MPRLQLPCRGWRTTASTRRCTSGVGGPGGNRRTTALYGVGRSLGPRSDRPGSTVRVIAMREEQWPASWRRSPLLCHDPDSELDALPVAARSSKRSRRGRGPNRRQPAAREHRVATGQHLHPWRHGHLHAVAARLAMRGGCRITFAVVGGTQSAERRRANFGDPAHTYVAASPKFGPWPRVMPRYLVADHNQFPVAHLNATPSVESVHTLWSGISKVSASGLPAVGPLRSLRSALTSHSRPRDA
jgi:hypothetical protein